MAIRYQAGGSNFETYEPGTYDFEIMEVVQNDSKKGNPQLKIKMQFIGGANDGKTYMDFRSLLPQAGFRVDALLDACGVGRTEAEDEKGNKVLQFEEQDLVGCCFRANITIREHEGKKFNDMSEECPLPEEVDAPTQAKTSTGVATPAPAAAPAASDAAPAAAGRFTRPRRTAGA